MNEMVRYDREKRFVYAAAAGIVFGAGLAVYGVKRYQKYLEEYKAACLYLAVMDDEICRNESEGRSVNGKELEFPCKQESLSYRYELFLEMYKGESIKNLKEKIEQFEIRLEESRREYQAFLQQQKDDTKEE